MDPRAPIIKRAPSLLEDIATEHIFGYIQAYDNITLIWRVYLLPLLLHKIQMVVLCSIMYSIGRPTGIIRCKVIFLNITASVEPL